MLNFKDSKVYEIAAKLGVEVIHLNDCPDKSAHWNYVLTNSKAMVHAENLSKIIITDATEPEEIEYVLAHELGHIISFTHIEPPTKMLNAKKLGDNTLAYLEEIQADFFARSLLDHLSLPIPTLYNNRRDMHDKWGVKFSTSFMFMRCHNMVQDYVAIHLTPELQTYRLK